MKSRTIAASVLVTCGLVLSEVAWRGLAMPGAATPAIRHGSRGVTALGASAGVLPWIAEIQRRTGGPREPSRAEALPVRAQGSLTLAENAPAAPGERARQDGASGESVSDDAEGIGEPADVETYFAAKDRAAAHGARSR